MAPFSRVKAAIADLIKDKIVVGHSLWNDLCVCAVFLSPA
jgi:uncharacterized membrane protein YjjP (DUF1212 family)